jgi:hypothetical protein
MASPMKKAPHCGAFFIGRHPGAADQNSELTATERKLTHAQTIIATTRVMGKAFLLNR